MHILLSVLLVGAGTCQGVYLQNLTCPYEMRYKALPRVWCRQSSALCCVGLSFSQQSKVLDGGRLEVKQDSTSFTVSVLEMANGDGVYWCGVLNPNNTITKLAEAYFHSSSGALYWSFARWILLPALPILTIFISFYSRSIKCSKEKEGELYSDIASAPVWSESDLQYENAPKPVCEMEW